MVKEVLNEKQTDLRLISTLMRKLFLKNAKPERPRTIFSLTVAVKEVWETQETTSGLPEWRNNIRFDNLRENSIFYEKQN